MTRTLTTVPPTTAPNLRSDWRFRALIAAIVVVTIALAAWTVAQQRTIDDTAGALPAPPQHSVRQIERAEETRAALQRLDEVEVRRFTNQATPLAPVRPDAHDLQRMEQTELKRFDNRGVQPAAEVAETAQQRALDYSHPGVQP